MCRQTEATGSGHPRKTRVTWTPQSPLIYGSLAPVSFSTTGDVIPSCSHNAAHVPTCSNYAIATSSSHLSGPQRRPPPHKITEIQYTATSCYIREPGGDLERSKCNFTNVLTRAFGNPQTQPQTLHDLRLSLLVVVCAPFMPVACSWCKLLTPQRDTSL